MNAPAPSQPKGRSAATWLMPALWLTGALLFALDWVVHRHEYFEWAQAPGFYVLYSFAACVLLVLAARSLAPLLRRPKNYYER